MESNHNLRNRKTCQAFIRNLSRLGDCPRCSVPLQHVGHPGSELGFFTPNGICIDGGVDDIVDGGMKPDKFVNIQHVKEIVNVLG